MTPSMRAEEALDITFLMTWAHDQLPEAVCLIRIGQHVLDDSVPRVQVWTGEAGDLLPG